MTTTTFIILMAMIALTIADGYNSYDGFKSGYGALDGKYRNRHDEYKGQHGGSAKGYDDGYKSQNVEHEKGYDDGHKGKDSGYGKAEYKFGPFSYSYDGPHGHFVEVAVKGPHDEFYKYGFTAGGDQSGYEKN